MTIRTHHRGNEYTIEAGDYRAIILQQGAALQSLTWQGKKIVVPSPTDQTVHACCGQILIPFPNRIEDGEYDFDGNHYLLPIDEHDRNNAIHGYGYRAMWDLVSLDAGSVTLSWQTPYLAGYPFDLTVTACWRLSEDGLGLTVTAHNHDSREAPWACAIHPWLFNGSDQAEGDAVEQANGMCHLTIPSDTHVTVNDRLLPTGQEPVEGTTYDLREGPSLEGRPFDDAWTSVDHDPATGLTSAVFTRPDGITVTLSGDRSVTSFQVCTGTGFAPQNRPQGVAVEPQTAYANAFRTGIDLLSIEPDGEVSTTFSFHAEEK